MSHHHGLKRELNLLHATAIGLGAIIGAGIFVVTGVAAGVAGPAFILSLVIAGIAATCNALSSAELATLYPQAGGTYEYGYQVVHPIAGFSAGWMFLTSKLAAAATVAIGLDNYARTIYPSLPPKLMPVALVVLLVIANLFGIRRTGWVNTSIVAVSVLALGYLIVAGIPQIEASHFMPFAPKGYGVVLPAAALMFFAYTGYSRLATLGEEVHDPKKTIPRAIGLSVAIALTLYLCVGVVSVGIRGADALAASNAPLQETARAIGAPGLAALVGLAAGTSLIGVALSQVLGISRMMFAMARRHDLPYRLATISPKHRVPATGIIVTGSLMIAIILLGTLEVAVRASAFTILLYYSITNIASLRIHHSEKRYHKTIAIVGLLFCLTLAFSMDAVTILSGCAVLAVGLIYRWLIHRGIIKNRPSEA